MVAAAQRAAALVEREPAYAHTRDLVVTHRGRVVLERRFHAGPELVDTYSMTKSVLATLVGIALDGGALASLDVPVAELLDGRARPGPTLRHLLTMTAGTEPLEIDDVMALPSRWVDRLLAARQRHPPGSRFVYDNGAAHVAGAALAAAVGTPLSDFAAEHLFAPLGIDRFAWPRDPDGRDYGFGHLRLRPRDVARIGELYLGGGEHRGRRVVSGSFVDAATTAQSSGGPPEDTAYGYLWWSAREPIPHFFAGGYAGQSLTVLPSLGVVAVTTGDEALLRPGWRNARHAVLAASAG